MGKPKPNLKRSPKRKRRSPASETSSQLSQHSIFDPPLTSLDAPDSPLSDYPDDLSECSEGREDKRVKHEPTLPVEKQAKRQSFILKISSSYISVQPAKSTRSGLRSLRQPDRIALDTRTGSDGSPPVLSTAGLQKTKQSPSSTLSDQSIVSASGEQSLIVPSNVKADCCSPGPLLSSPLGRPELQILGGAENYHSGVPIPRSSSAPPSGIVKKSVSSQVEAKASLGSLPRPSSTQEPEAYRSRQQSEPAGRTLVAVKESYELFSESIKPNQLNVSNHEPANGPVKGGAQGLALAGPTMQANRLPIPEAICHQATSSDNIVQGKTRSHQKLEPVTAGMKGSPGSPTLAPPDRSAIPGPNLDWLKTLARALAPPRDASSPKPEPSSQPEVWAESRQELCETLHYFRAYHSGGYTNGGFAWGFMFDKSAHSRDYNDSNVIISRAGGGMVKNKDSGEMLLGGDQAENNQTLSLRNSMRYFNPVVIIAGADNPVIPSKPPHTYCVLDYFKPTHIWCEKVKGKTMIRYRFEKLNAQKHSWWQPTDKEELVALGELPPPVIQTCKSCNEKSEQIYMQGWMCLQPPCAQYWKLASGIEPNEDDLLYDPRFLKQKTPWPNEDHSYSLTSNNVELSGHAVAGEDCSRAFWAGMVCPDCGRCILRLSWMAWECPCGFTKSLQHTLIPAKTLADPYFPLSTGYSLSRDMHQPHIGLEVIFQHNYRINKYTIPGIDGFVIHLISNKPITEEPGGPDDMFEELQTRDVGLRRRPLGTGLIKGESYTRQYLVNYGMPYKFIAATSSQSFDGAAKAITSTRSRLNWVSKFIVQEKHQEFNETLVLGYFEQQKVNYHDDGEFGLGPTIATLSLGAPGTMKLRMKARHYNGVSRDGIYNDAPPMPGCEKYTERLAAANDLASLKVSSPKDYRARLKSISKELGLKAGGQARDAITMAVGHGDIVIMHGAEIQKYYEHAVEHSGKLRFALTCRYIDPDSLKDADKPQYEVGPDLGVYDGANLGKR